MEIVEYQPEPLAGDDTTDLKTLMEAYERSLILAALGAVSGRQRSAARLLGLLPTTFHEKMKRLGIRPQRMHLAAAASGAELVSATLQWKGSLPPGGTLELRGLNGSVRIEAAEGTGIEVSAVRRGPRANLSAVEVKVVEHPRGVSVCAICPSSAQASLPRVEQRTSRLLAGVRVDLVAHVPPGIHVVASTLNEDIDVVGLTSNVEARTANGQVRFLPFERQASAALATGPSDVGAASAR